MNKGQTFDYKFAYTIDGVCRSHGDFSRPGEGTIEGTPSELEDGSLQIKMIESAMRVFKLINKDVEQYAGISALSVSISNVERVK